MEVLHAVYAKIRTRVSTRLKLHMAREYCEGKASIVCEDYFISLNRYLDELSGKGAFEMRHFSLHFFSLVCISRIFVFKFLVHLRTVYESPQKLARPLGNIG